jgi:GNAT superfamily N-acetyltransferase
MLRQTLKKDKKLLKNLYNASFLNEADFCTRFFDDVWNPDYSFVIEENDEIIAMVTALPINLNFNDKIYKSRYIYAAATEKDNRNKGYMARLLKFVEDKFKAENIDFLTLIVGEESLLKFYSKFNFVPCGKVFESEIKAKNLNLNYIKASDDDYEEIIDFYNHCVADFIRAERNIKFLKSHSKIYESDFYICRAENKNIKSCLFGYKEGKIFRAVEVLGDDKDKLASQIAFDFSCDKAIFSYPENNGKFIGMAKGLNSNAEKILKNPNNNFYLNLMFN